jgi:putative chitinase
MCIAGSVGQGGKNARADVRTVQLLLNLNLPQVAGPLVPGGKCGPATIATIEQFQHGVVGDNDVAGLVTPEAVGGTTLQALRGGMPGDLVEQKLEGIYIGAAAATVVQFFGALLAGMTSGSINTPLRQAHFLAQVGHESGQLRYTEEIASGAAYEGRKDLGNTQPGDGVRFKGRGLIQLTGRANYAAFAQACGQDVVADPDLVAEKPRLAVDAAVWFWGEHGLNALADKDDVLGITKCINGGTNGLADREALLARAKWFLMDPHPDGATAGLVRAIRAVAAMKRRTGKPRLAHLPRSRRTL